MQLSIATDDAAEDFFGATNASQAAEAAAAEAAAAKQHDLGRSTQGVPAILKDRLKASATKVINLFQAWDNDGDGQVSKKEFRKGLEVLGIEMSRREVEMFYEAYDPDNSGQLDFRELNKVLRSEAGAGAVDDALRPGGGGEIVGASKNKHALRQVGTSSLDRAAAKATAMAQGLGTDLLGGDGAGSDLASVTATLREAMQKNQQKVISLFTSWDADGNGSVSRGEFGMALEMLGLDAPREAVAALFDEFDADNSGTVEFAELNAQLRKRAATLPEELQPGSVKIQTERGNKIAIRKEKAHDGGLQLGNVLGGASGAGADGASVQQQLRAALTKNWARVKDLFLSWDTNNDGVVSRDEFAKALKALGFDAPKTAVDGIFASFDLDNSGEVEFEEMNNLLRAKPPPPKIDEPNPRQRCLLPPPPKWKPSTEFNRSLASTAPSLDPTPSPAPPPAAAPLPPLPAPARPAVSTLPALPSASRRAGGASGGAVVLLGRRSRQQRLSDDAAWFDATVRSVVPGGGGGMTVPARMPPALAPIRAGGGAVPTRPWKRPPLRAAPLAPMPAVKPFAVRPPTKRAAPALPTLYRAREVEAAMRTTVSREGDVQFRFNAQVI